MARAKEFLQNVFAWAVAGAMAAPIALVFILMMAGCSSTRSAPDATLRQAEDACFSGTMAAYQRISRDEKVNVVCK